MSEQSSEVVTVGNEKLYIRRVYPLETVFWPKEISPSEHWDLTPNGTSENRGYYASWEIKNGALYLKDIETYRRVKKGFWFWAKYSFRLVPLEELFPEAVNGPVKATWFTGGFSGYTKSTVNPVDDKLSLTLVNGDVTEHHWYHLHKKDGKEVAVEYEKPLQ